MESDSRSPVVLLLGCPELVDHLAARHIDSEEAESFSFLEARQGSEARAIVLRGSAITSDLTGAVQALREAWPLVDILVWSPHASAERVREALQAGAKDVLLTESPDICARAVDAVIDAQQLLPRAARLGYEEKQPSQFGGILSRSSRMWDIFDTVTRVAPTDAPVLILGETGTGKDLLARVIHQRSGREGKFVAINCAAVAEPLIDSELFGHVRGAFTGATISKEGLFRHADSGTLMLDEIGDVPLTAQLRLLRALQERAVRPVGGHDEIPVDVRIIAATSVGLDQAVREDRFREDLYYRLDVIRIEIPPLRERPEDILFLFGQFMRRFCDQYNCDRPVLASTFLDALVEYPWPGNVRQLENFTERLVLTHPAHRVTARHVRSMLPDLRRPAASPAHEAPAPQPVPAPPDVPVTVDRTLAEHVEPLVEALERRYLEAALTQTGGRMQQAADLAGISRRTLLRKLTRYGLDKREFKP